MKVPILAILALILTSLACGTYITPTPTLQAPSPSATVAASPLPPTQTVTVPTSTEAAGTAIVRQAIVNLRDAPDGAVIGTLNAGDVVTVDFCTDNWCKVSTDVKSGYVFAGCLTELAGDRRCEAK